MPATGLVIVAIGCLKKLGLTSFWLCSRTSPGCSTWGAEPVRRLPRYLIEHRCRMTGVDASSAMITMAADRFPDHGWLVADMRSLDLNRKFDGIIAWDSSFHLSAADQRRMFPIFKRHAAPGAALMFTSGPSAGERIGQYRGEPLYHASLDTVEYRTLLRDNGFDVVTHVVEDPTCGAHTIWLARMAPAHALRGRTDPR